MLTEFDSVQPYSGMVRWPSGLRRQTKDQLDIQAPYLVRKGVGSNPTLISFCPERREVWRNLNLNF